MTQPEADGTSKNGSNYLKTLLGWLRRPVSVGAIVAAFAGVGVAAAIFIAVGGVNVSADKPDGWVTAQLLHFVFKRSEGSRSGGDIPPDDLAAPSRMRLAAQHFDMVCANCHGRPGFGQSVVALSMSPAPQYLPKVLNQFTDRELYRIVEHGVKFSAMPSWATDARGDEVWSMVAFLRRLPKLDAKSYHDMTALGPEDAAVQVGSGEGASLQSADVRRHAQVFDEFLYAAPAAGFSDQTIHKSPVATCARCHGADGSGAATGGEAPNLTLQNAAYLQAALKAYVSGARKSGFMRTIATELSDAQIADLSTYYAALPVQAAPSSSADPALIQRGETIATEGLRESATPACANCHESAGGQIIGAPHIAGQSATFLRRQLAAMSHGGRGSTVTWNPMPTVAHDLSDKDIIAVAAYYSGLKPAKAAGGEPAAHQPQAPPPGNLAATEHIFASVCLKCHINSGRGDLQGNYPNLTIQGETYAAHSLYAFHTGARLNDKMRQVADSLTLDQMTSLARYISSLAPHPALAQSDATAAARGAAIATMGASARGVPACLSCHGAKGVAALPLIPALQGQNVAYLRRKLDAFARPYPENRDALNPMPAIASKLTDQERADLAAYFAAASPLPKTTIHP